MMKKALLLLIPILMLAWCWNSEEEKAKDELQKRAEEVQARQEALKIKEATESLPRWSSYSFNQNGDGEIAIKIYDVTTDENWNTIVRLEWENISKAPSYFYIWAYDTFLETEDWYRFEAKSVEQVPPSERPEWYGWCISCSTNPWKKNVEDAIFETTWWKYLILIDDNIRTEVKFEL